MLPPYGPPAVELLDRSVVKGAETTGSPPPYLLFPLPTGSTRWAECRTQQTRPFAYGTDDGGTRFLVACSNA